MCIIVCVSLYFFFFFFFFFNDTATTEIYTLSLHDALPIYDFHDRGRLLCVGEVDAEAAADCGVAVEWPSGPPAGDALGGGDQVVHALGRGVDADAVQDVGHCGVLAVFGVSVGCGSRVQAATKTSSAAGISAGAPVRRPVIANAVSAASTANTTQDHSAGRNPAVTEAGSPRWPWAANTALAIAIEKTAPKRCAM